MGRRILYYDPSNHSKPVKATQFPTISGSQTFKQVTKANPSQKELTSSSSFSNKQIVVAANPTPLYEKSRYWQKDLNQPILVIKREFFSENPMEIAAKAFHYPSSDLLKTREFYEHILVETNSDTIDTQDEVICNENINYVKTQNQIRENGN